MLKKLTKLFIAMALMLSLGVCTAHLNSTSIATTIDPEPRGGHVKIHAIIIDPEPRGGHVKIHATTIDPEPRGGHVIQHIA